MCWGAGGLALRRALAATCAQLIGIADTGVDVGNCLLAESAVVPPAAPVMNASSPDLTRRKVCSVPRRAAMYASPPHAALFGVGEREPLPAALRRVSVALRQLLCDQLSAAP